MSFNAKGKLHRKKSGDIVIVHEKVAVTQPMEISSKTLLPIPTQHVSQTAIGKVDGVVKHCVLEMDEPTRVTTQHSSLGNLHASVEEALPKTASVKRNIQHYQSLMVGCYLHASKYIARIPF